jgi:uncharacterized protein YndB with AHSA1/START domain
MNYSRPKTIELTITRAVAASPAEVFDVWTDSTSPGSPWFGITRAIVQPVVDGLFYHLVQFDGRDWAHYGRFTALDRPRRIEHTWVSEATRGLESLVALTFEPQGDQTVVTLQHSNVPDDEFGRSHENGWGFVLDMMVERFARRSRTA